MGGGGRAGDDLYDAVEVLFDLFGGVGLLLRGGGNLRHHLIDRGYGLANKGERIAGNAGEGNPLAGRGASLLGEAADFSNDDGEAIAMLAGTGGFKGGIEGEQVGLRGDLADEAGTGRRFSQSAERGLRCSAPQRQSARSLLRDPIAHKPPQRQRIGQTPRDSSLAVDALEVPDQKRSEVNARRQSGPPHARRIELPAKPFHKRVELPPSRSSFGR
jgi:hypothetical protein